MENKYKIWLFVISTTFACGGLLGFYISRQYYGDVETRLQSLETQFAANIKPGQEIKMEEVKIWISKSEENIRKEYDILYKFGLPFTIISLLTAIFGANKWAAEIAKQKAEDTFKDPETLLKEGKKILVITPDGQDTEFITIFFHLMGFRTPEYIKVTEIDKYKSKDFDLAVLNVPNDKSKITSEFNDKIALLTMAKSVFYFGPGQVSNYLLEKEGRLSFANAKSQLYSNLINALKFQKML